MSETDEHGYPFLEDWLRRQQEPLADFGVSPFANTKLSPLTIDRLPERKQKTFFEEEVKNSGGR